MRSFFYARDIEKTLQLSGLCVNEIAVLLTLHCAREKPVGKVVFAFLIKMELVREHRENWETDFWENSIKAKKWLTLKENSDYMMLSISQKLP